LKLFISPKTRFILLYNYTKLIIYIIELFTQFILASAEYWYSFKLYFTNLRGEILSHKTSLTPPLFMLGDQLFPLSIIISKIKCVFSFSFSPYSCMYVSDFRHK
jgi:hypothetical protein